MTDAERVHQLRELLERFIHVSGKLYTELYTHDTQNHALIELDKLREHLDSHFTPELINPEDTHGKSPGTL